MNTESIFSEYMKEKYGVKFPGEITFQDEEEGFIVLEPPQKYSPCKFVIRAPCSVSLEEIFNLVKNLLKEGDSLELFFTLKEK